MTIDSGRMSTALPSTRLRIPRADTHAYVLVLIFGMFFVLLFVPGGSKFRHIIYTLPFLSLVLAITLADRGRLLLHKPFAVACLAFGAATFMSIIVNANASFEVIRNVLIVLGSMMIFLPQFRVLPQAVKLLVGIFALSMACSAVFKGVSANADLVGSQGVLEHPAAFPLGILTLYFWRMKSYKWSALSFVLCFLAFKRIALLALLVSLAVDFITRLVSHSEAGLRRKTAVAALLVLIGSAALAFSFDEVIVFVIRTFDIDMSANQFSLGRYFYALLVDHHMAAQGEIQWLFGNGPGFADTLITLEEQSEGRLHNDYKKILLEYGVVGSVIFFAALYRLYGTNRDGYLILVNIALIYVTDNAFQFIYYYFTCFMVLRAFVDHGPTAAPVSAPRARSP